MSHPLLANSHPISTASGRSAYELIHRFGENTDVGTSFEPITATGTYWQPTSASTLEIVSAEANDTVDGTRARKVRIYGLDADFREAEEDVELNGTSASAATTTSFIRVTNATVCEVGTYNSNNQGLLTIRISGGGATVATIPATEAAAPIAAYTIPVNRSGYLTNLIFFTETQKTVTLKGTKLENADVVTAPFAGAKTLFMDIGPVAGGPPINVNLQYPIAFPPKTDIVFEGLVDTGTTTMSCDFELILV